MLGQHPRLYATPELGVFVADRLADLGDLLPPEGRHGLLRTLAQLYTGEQTLESVDMARRWIRRRATWAPEAVYREICERIAPLVLVDRCTCYTDPRHPASLRRLAAAYPDAGYIHLVRHPLAQGRDWLGDPFAIQQLTRLGSTDPTAGPAAIDPQFDWLHRHAGILAFLQDIPDERQYRLLAEDLTETPTDALRDLCDWLGIERDLPVLDAMLHPEEAPYAGPGPYGAEFGFAPAFLRAPHYRHAPRQDAALDRPLPWRRDGKGFTPELVELARRVGYAEPAPLG